MNSKHLLVACEALCRFLRSVPDLSEFGRARGSPRKKRWLTPVAAAKVITTEIPAELLDHGRFGMIDWSLRLGSDGAESAGPDRGELVNFDQVVLIIQRFTRRWPDVKRYPGEAERAEGDADAGFERLLRA